jgi:hypothetical protein
MTAAHEVPAVRPRSIRADARDADARDALEDRPQTEDHACP